MNIPSSIEQLFKKVLPAPFTIAVLLTFFVFLLAFGSNVNHESTALNILGYWEKGLWDSPLLVFAIQMMLMLVLGHVLALTHIANRLIQRITLLCTNTATAAAWVTFFTLIVSFFNWGLGLIFGAIFARKVAEQAAERKLNLYYPIVGAAGYSGLMVWHGGISGSAPLKVAESGHLEQLLKGSQIDLPDAIPFTDTVFSNMNITVAIALLIALPILMYLIGKKNNDKSYVLPLNNINSEAEVATFEKGAEQLDKGRILPLIFGSFILIAAFNKAFIQPTELSLNFINPNFINLCLLGFSLLLHKSISHFLNAIDQAIGGASGILIQFPLYFGIMGIMKHSGLAGAISDFFANHSTATSFPIFSFFSAGLINIFVPSGGGQWGVQGPILIEAATKLGVPLWKSVMSLAYGDQLTNMLQPFWALPLLGITGLKAKSILPYTLLLMLCGALIFIIGLLLF